jgi:hypothetical protein
MPEGYTKLTCDDCGGKLVMVDNWMPRYCISTAERLQGAEMDRLIDTLEHCAGNAIVLDKGIEITSVRPETLSCESCGALYERNNTCE